MTELERKALSPAELAEIKAVLDDYFDGKYLSFRPPTLVFSGRATKRQAGKFNPRRRRITLYYHFPYVGVLAHEYAHALQFMYGREAAGTPHGRVFRFFYVEVMDILQLVVPDVEGS